MNGKIDVVVITLVILFLLFLHATGRLTALKSEIASAGSATTSNTGQTGTNNALTGTYNIPSSIAGSQSPANSIEDFLASGMPPS